VSVELHRASLLIRIGSRVDSAKSVSRVIAYGTTSPAASGRLKRRYLQGDVQNRDESPHRTKRFFMARRRRGES
jgi:hypothetical protein